jgi:hypothetical protein
VRVEVEENDTCVAPSDCTPPFLQHGTDGLCRPIVCADWTVDDASPFACKRRLLQNGGGCVYIYGYRISCVCMCVHLCVCLCVRICACML